MKTPFFSIIIPTHNEEKLLPRLLKSLKQQSYTDFEVIVADNNSSDMTPQICADNEVKTVRGDNKPGVGRNNGAKVARGQYLVFLDADTQVESNFLGELRTEIQKHDFTAASGFFVGDGGNGFDKMTHAVLNYYFWTLQKIDPHACGFYFVVRRDIFKKMDGFDPKLFIAEDHDLAWRINKSGKFVFLRNPRVIVSVRRVENDGLAKTVAKGLYVEVYRIFQKRITKELFDYQMGGSASKDTNESL